MTYYSFYYYSNILLCYQFLVIKAICFRYLTVQIPSTLLQLPEVLLDPLLLSGVTSPANLYFEEHMDSQATDSLNRNWASDQSLEFRENI